MPNYKGHVCGGIAAYSFAIFGMYVMCGFVHFTFLHGVICLFCTLFGALFPDVDTKSRGQRYFYQLLCVILVVYICKKHFIAVSICALLAIVPLLSRHRGIFHQAWFLIILTIGIVAGILKTGICSISYVYHGAFFFLVGAFSHLFLDFAPFSFKKRRWR